MQGVGPCVRPPLGLGILQDLRVHLLVGHQVGSDEYARPPQRGEIFYVVKKCLHQGYQTESNRTKTKLIKGESTMESTMELTRKLPNLNCESNEYR